MSSVEFDFSGRRFVVTGASSGMGCQLVREICAGGVAVWRLRGVQMS